MHVGGIVGNATVTGSDSTYVARCYNLGTITSTNEKSGFAGGIGGTLKAFVEDCYNVGDVTGAGKNVGGIAGYNGSQSKAMYRCFNVGNVTGALTDVGGIAGAGRFLIYDCYNFGTVTGTDNVVVFSPNLTPVRQSLMPQPLPIVTMLVRLCRKAAMSAPWQPLIQAHVNSTPW